MQHKLESKREREIMCVCLYACEREMIENQNLRMRERVCVLLCVRVYVCEREREKEKLRYERGENAKGEWEGRLSM